MSSTDVLISAQAELKYENKKTDSRVFTSLTLQAGQVWCINYLTIYYCNHLTAHYTLFLSDIWYRETIGISVEINFTYLNLGWKKSNLTVYLVRLL